MSPGESSDQTDTDGDDLGDVCDTDDDGDGVLDVVDNCPLSYGLSADQTNTDSPDDLMADEGDVCDTDDDNDGVADGDDVCPDYDDAFKDTDHDGKVDCGTTAATRRQKAPRP